MIATILSWIGGFIVLFAILGALDFCHFRLYIGVEDKIIVSKSEYESLKAKSNE